MNSTAEKVSAEDFNHVATNRLIRESLESGVEITALCGYSRVARWHTSPHGQRFSYDDEKAVCSKCAALLGDEQLTPLSESVVEG